MEGPEDLVRGLVESGMTESDAEMLVQTKEGMKEALRWLSGLSNGISADEAPLRPQGPYECKHVELGNDNIAWSVGRGSTSRCTIRTSTSGDSFVDGRNGAQSAVHFPNQQM